jgi:acyl-[acyl carrier protein]--UDP-N-acetylglucosamine O-acyltransferase
MVAVSATIGPLAVVGRDAVIGERAPHRCLAASSAPEASIGADAVLHANVTVYDRCVVGPRSVLHSGAVIGADGFGMAEENGRWLKIAQIGRVVLGADVEVGANTTIDRGAIDDTVIENDVKLDNQIQVGHNCRIGAHTAIAGCVGIAGSTRIGKNCKIGGAAMIGGHIEICDDAVVSGGTAVSSSITAPGALHRDRARASAPPVAARAGGRASFAGTAAAYPAAGRRGYAASEHARRTEGGTMSVADDGSMDIEEIMRYLPHRYPFLLVDRVTSLEAGKSIRGIKNVTMNEPYFIGHFPSYPVMPAVLVIEALAQLASILAYKITGRTPGDGRSFSSRDRRRALSSPGSPGRPADPRVGSAAHGARHWQIRRARQGRRRNRRRGEPDGRRCAYRTSRSDRCRAFTRRRWSTRRPSSPTTSRWAPIRSSAPTCGRAPGTIVGPHVVLTGRTRLGERNRFSSSRRSARSRRTENMAVSPPRTTIGDDNVFREFTTINAGTAQDRGDTQDRQRQSFPGVHARRARLRRRQRHDVLEQCAARGSRSHRRLGRHGRLFRRAPVLPGRRHAMIAAGAIVLQDVPPFVTAAGYPATPRGINAEGLRRRGFAAADILAVRRAYKTLYREGRTLEDAKEALAAAARSSPSLTTLVEFLAVPGRGISPN